LAGSAPYNQYEHLPPIKTQFSIESDSDMTESTGLIQEYDVFDPGRPRPKIIFVIGGPGSGKGTQSNRMAFHFGFVCVSVGEILRNQMIHRATSDRKWELIAKIIANGELAPSETAIEELKQQFIKQQDAKGFVVDGFPRDISQAFTFEEQIGSPDLVVFLACSSQQLHQRLEKRAQEQGRLDDRSHAIERRLETFKLNVPLIVKYYQEKGAIVRFDADREEDDIFADISNCVQQRLRPEATDVPDSPLPSPLDNLFSPSQESPKEEKTEQFLASLLPPPPNFIAMQPTSSNSRASFAAPSGGQNHPELRTNAIGTSLDIIASLIVISQTLRGAEFDPLEEFPRLSPTCDQR
ncbi:adenylate kinase isoenzyme 5-like, partial [Elgaria multicarinata webbii]|uniref:adenylate kinase isoenzyme 5-like n=1 Tax=Elgaria multicarinata webbii TaxID=159646 RepID=UPI002FCD0A5E